MAEDNAPVANPLGIVAKGAAGAAAGLVAGLVVGWVLCFGMDLLWERGKPAYAYVIWVLVPAIAVFLTLSSAGEWAASPPPGKPSWIYRPDATRIGLLLVAGAAIAIALAYLLCAQLGWSPRDDDFWVPGSKPHTIAFFIGGVFGAIGSWWMARMEAKPAD